MSRWGLPVSAAVAIFGRAGAGKNESDAEMGDGPIFADDVHELALADLRTAFAKVQSQGRLTISVLLLGGVSVPVTNLIKLAAMGASTDLLLIVSENDLVGLPSPTLAAAALNSDSNAWIEGIKDADDSKALLVPILEVNCSNYGLGRIGKSPCCTDRTIESHDVERHSCDQLELRRLMELGDVSVVSPPRDWWCEWSAGFESDVENISFKFPDCRKRGLDIWMQQTAPVAVDYDPRLTASLLISRRKLLQRIPNGAGAKAGVTKLSGLELAYHSWAAAGGKLLFAPAALFLYVSKPANLLTVTAESSFQQEANLIMTEKTESEIYPVHDVDGDSQNWSSFDLSEQAEHEINGSRDCVVNIYGTLPLYFETLLLGGVRTCGFRLRHAIPIPTDDQARVTDDQDSESFYKATDVAPNSIVVMSMGPSPRDIMRAHKLRGMLLKRLHPLHKNDDRITQQNTDRARKVEEVSMISSAKPALMPRGNEPLGHVGLIYLGETEKHFPIDSSLRDASAFVLYQHWRANLSNDEKRKCQQIWLPLGTSDAYHSRMFTGEGGDSSRRRFLWSWVSSSGEGSSEVAGAGELGQMLDALERHTRWEELRASGYLMVFGPGEDDGAYDANFRATVLHQTIFAPCPSASQTSAETQRVWEALEAGAVPVLVRQASLTAVERILGHDGVVWLSSWADLPNLLLSVQPQDTSQMLSRCRKRYELARRAMALRLAGLVCGLCPVSLMPVDLPVARNMEGAGESSPDTGAVFQSRGELFKDSLGIPGNDSKPTARGASESTNAENYRSANHERDVWAGETEGHDAGPKPMRIPFGFTTEPPSSEVEAGAGACVVNIYGRLPLALQAPMWLGSAACGLTLRPLPHPHGHGDGYLPHSLVVLNLVADGGGADRCIAVLERMAERQELRGVGLATPSCIHGSRNGTCPQPSAHEATDETEAWLGNVGVVLLGGEQSRAPAATSPLYRHAAFALHQLWRADLDGSASATHGYLLSPASADDGPGKGRLHWLPRGYDDDFHPTSVRIVPVAARRLLWSWDPPDTFGGSGYSYDGHDCPALAALQAHPAWDQLRARGRWKPLSAEDSGPYAMPGGGAEALRAAARRAVLYETQLALCPPGGAEAHPETSRLWESLEAGAVPVMARSPALAPVESILGDDGAVWLDSWSELPSLLIQLGASEIGRLASSSRRRYLAMRRSLKEKLARSVCGLCPPH